MFTSANSSTLYSTPSTFQPPVSFAMSAPSTHTMPITILSSKAVSHKGPRRAYKQVLAKLHAGLTSLRLKVKKTKKPATGGQLAPVAADASAEKFGRPIRAIVLPDPYYGWEHTAKVSARFITQLFDCPSTLPGISPDDEYPDLAQFIAYALFLCQLDPIVNEHALCLLFRLKLEHPDISPSHGHALYLDALRLAANLAGNGDCTAEDWAMVGQWMFSTEQLETGQFYAGGLLEWDLKFEVEERARIMEYVQRGEVPYPEPVLEELRHFDDDDVESMHSINTSSSLSTCTIPSTWSLASMRGWGESSRSDSAVTTAPGEKVNTHPYPDLESWTSLPSSNASEPFG